MTYSDIGDCISYIAKEQEKPLAVYYFGLRNGPNQERVANGTSSGAFVVNETIYQILNPNLPFGGVGHSGYGRTHGSQGFATFSNMKSYLVKPSLNCFPFNLIYPPYTEAVKRQTLVALQFGKYTQAQFCNSLIIFVLIVVVAWLAVTYRTDLLNLQLSSKKCEL